MIFQFWRWHQAFFLRGRSSQTWCDRLPPETQENGQRQA